MSVERELLIAAVEWLQDLKYMWADTRDSGDWVLLELIADINKIEQLLAQPEQEPVAWMNDSGGCFLSDGNKYSENWTALYTAPPKREPLSDDEIESIWGQDSLGSTVEFVRAIEKAHGIGGGE